jgi:hypothetical protein
LPLSLARVRADAPLKLGGMVEGAMVEEAKAEGGRGGAQEAVEKVGAAAVVARVEAVTVVVVRVAARSHSSY